MAPHADRLVNPVKARMQAGEVALGMPVRLARSGDIARIAKTTGHDFIFIDGQHSLFNLETIGHIASTALNCGIAALVRVRGIDDPDVSLLLDNGVMGIVYPDVNTAAQARKAVDICKFAPLGKRSVTAGYPHFDYRSVPLTESVPQLNDSCLLVCMIETVEGLENVEAIAAVDGVDVIHLGSNDLLANMGKPGQIRRSGFGGGAGAPHCRLPQARQVRRLRRQPRCGASGRSGPQGLPVSDHPVGYRLPVGGGVEMDRRHPRRAEGLNRLTARAAR